MGEAVRMTQTGTRGGYRYVANCFICQILEGNEQSFVYNIFMTWKNMHKIRILFRGFLPDPHQPIFDTPTTCGLLW